MDSFAAAERFGTGASVARLAADPRPPVAGLDLPDCGVLVWTFVLLLSYSISALRMLGLLVMLTSLRALWGENRSGATVPRTHQTWTRHDTCDHDSAAVCTVLRPPVADVPLCSPPPLMSTPRSSQT